MPGKFEIMRAVQKGLDSLPITADAAHGKWNPAVKTELCKIGRDRFGYYVCARDVDETDCDQGEWLYDVTWLEYEKNGRIELKARRKLVDAPLVAECEWGGLGDIYDDFEKILLARVSVRLMIFDGTYEPGSKEIAKRLAERVREFNASRAEDAWLLAAWERSDDEEKGWSFKYFTIEMHTAIPVLLPFGG